MDGLPRIDLTGIKLPTFRPAGDPPAAPPADVFTQELRTETPGIMPHVRFEGLGDTAAVRAHYAQTRPIVESMLDPSTRPDERHALGRDLGILPMALLEKAKARGLQIYVARPGQPCVPPQHRQALEPQQLRELSEKLGVETYGYFIASPPLLILAEAAVPDPSPVLGHHRTVLHEFGHFVQSLEASDPKLGEIHQKDVAGMRALRPILLAELAQRYPNGYTDEQLERLAEEVAAKHGPLPTGNAMKSPDEAHADAFEAWFTADRADGIRTPGGDGSHERLQQNAPEMYGFVADQLKRLGDG